jgi:hypothetical protein
MSRAQRRHDTQKKHVRRRKLWTAVHSYARGDIAEYGHKIKFWPMRCRCDYCAQSRTRDLRTPSASPEAADHDWRRG